MADSETSLFTFLIMFWTLLTILSSVFANYLEEPISSSITDFTPDNEAENIVVDSEWSFEKWVSGLFDTIEELPIIGIFVPLIKILTFGYTDKIPAIVSIFLNATLLFTYYVVWGMIKK